MSSERKLHLLILLELETGEGEGGIIGIEFNGTQGKPVADFNRGMIHAWIDNYGEKRFAMFHDEC